MNEKVAKKIAKYAALEAYNLTLKKLAQETYIAPDAADPNRPTHVTDERTEGKRYDKEDNTGGEIKYERIEDRKVNRPDYGSESLFAKDKCPECGCVCGEKKEDKEDEKKEAAYRRSKLMAAAAKMKASLAR